MYTNVHNWFNKKVNFNFIIQKAYLLVKDLSTLRSKRELRTRRFISQWTKTGCDLLYNGNSASRFHEKSGGLTNRIEVYPMQKNQWLNKHLSELTIAYRRSLNKRFCELFFCNLSRIKYRNIFYVVKQFRFITTISTKKTVENFDRNYIDMLNSWKVSLKFMEQQIFLVHVQKENGELHNFSKSQFPELFKQMKALNESYCFLVSMILKQNYKNETKTCISLKSFFTDIKKLQQWFIESPAICWFAIQQIRTSSGSTISGVDKIAFTSLAKKKREYTKFKWTNTRYSKILKSFKIKKNFQKVFIITEQIEKILLNTVVKENDELCWLLFKKCVVKSLTKNYRGGSIRRARVCIFGNSLIVIMFLNIFFITRFVDNSDRGNKQWFVLLMYFSVPFLRTDTIGIYK